ncbi:MAG: glycoside hydrolase family 127 protein [Caldilineaceae bacterium]
MNDYPIQPISFNRVTVDDSFWSPRLETNRTVTIPVDFQRCEETERILNFDRAAGVDAGDHAGIFFNDSDVFKVIEGAAYSLQTHADPELDAYLDALIARIGAAQEPDGYSVHRPYHPRKLRVTPTGWAERRRLDALVQSARQPRALQRGPHVRGRGRPLRGHGQAHVSGHRAEECRPGRQVFGRTPATMCPATRRSRSGWCDSTVSPATSAICARPSSSGRARQADDRLLRQLREPGLHAGSSAGGGAGRGGGYAVRAVYMYGGMADVGSPHRRCCLHRRVGPAVGKRGGT